MARKSALFTALGLGSAAAVWAARRLHVLLANSAVQMAAGSGHGAEPDRTASGPERTASEREAEQREDMVTVVTTGDPGSNLPARTWVVDNGSDWDGHPGELVILPWNRTAPGQETE